MTRGRSGAIWRRVTAPIRANATECWRCGKWLDPDLAWPHPHSVTIGHIIALEDGGAPEDPSNLAAECIQCNMGDGARRTNAKRGLPSTIKRTVWRNSEW